MSSLHRLVSIAALGVSSFFSSHGFAYCLTHTCDVKKEMCDIEPGTLCNIGGKPLYWASSIVTWSIQKDGSALDGISAETLREVVENAFGRWEAADCGGGLHPKISLEGYPTGNPFIVCAKPEYNQNQPNANVITFHDSTWPYAESGAETLALTTVYFNPNSGEIYDANVEINSNLQTFALTDAQYPTVDLNSVLTHELGHFLGLSHSSITSATMFSNYDEGMKTLEADDVAAICASLPPGRDTVDSDLPRHGFSTDCGVAEKGCCSSTIGGPSPSGQRLGVWAFGLGLCAFAARSRLRRSGRPAALRR
ncbi:MAG: matrixin family metalloprotease [Myxococcales bacterium]